MVVMFMMSSMMGLGMGAGVLTGQNLGADQPERAEKTGWLALGIAEGIMILASGAIWMWAEYIVCIFNTDPSLVALAARFMRIAAAGYPVFSSIAVLQHVLGGAGEITREVKIFGEAVIPEKAFLQCRATFEDQCVPQAIHTADTGENP